MRAREVVERGRWRLWQVATGVGAISLLAWGVLRWDTLAGRTGQTACPMSSGFDELLPGDCWLVRGVLGVPAVSAEMDQLIWRVIALAVGAMLVALFAAGSSPRRRHSGVIWGLAWSIGLWVSVWAAERNAELGAGLWWATRVVVWAPAAMATVLVISLRAQSPWQTLEPPGLRSARRRRLSRLDEAWGLPEVSRVPAPIRLTWPVQVPQPARS